MCHSGSPRYNVVHILYCSDIQETVLSKCPSGFFINILISLALEFSSHPPIKKVLIFTQERVFCLTGTRILFSSSIKNVLICHPDAYSFCRTGNRILIFSSNQKGSHFYSGTCFLSYWY